MSLKVIEGPAGVGKTTLLMIDLASLLDGMSLDEQQRVLALSKMHGSRRRLHRRLTGVDGLGSRFDCWTLDSFAWRLLRRWRSIARIRFGSPPNEDDYAEVCRRTGALLANDGIRGWVSRTYPIVVIDEIQDCRDGQLAIIQALAAVSICVVAGDDFQDLDCDGENRAVAWAREQGEVVSLDRNRRTSVSGLLDAARALRGGREVREGRGFKLRGARNKNVAASFVCRYLTYWSGAGDIAVISPVGPGASRFVRDLLMRVEEKPFEKDGTVFGPHRVPWESSQAELEAEFLEGLHLPENPESIVAARALDLEGSSGARAALARWCERQRRVTGRTEFAAAEVRAEARRISQRARSYRRARARGVKGMTVHQAKNREFDSVIVLWPYEIAGSSERLRRLLYNAVTRAKRQALVIVQNPRRLSGPPFTGGD